MAAKCVTQLEIARVARVSQPAVAAVVGHTNKPGTRVSEATRQRILEVANTLGYRPNRFAQAIRSGRSKLIGMIYFGGPLQVINERAHFVGRHVEDIGYELLTIDVHWYEGGIKGVIDRALGSNFEGLILTGGVSAEALADVRRRGIPMVALSSVPLLDAPMVCSDMQRGMRHVADHLMSGGHQRILQLCDGTPGVPIEQWQRPARTQVLGVKEAVDEAGGTLEIGDADDYLKWISQPGEGVRAFALCQPFEVVYFNPYHFARKAMRSIGGASSLPHAIICPNDEWAVGCFTELAARGVSVPGDVAVTGFNDSALAANFPVGLTSVRQSTEKEARKAVELVLTGIENPDLFARQKKQTFQFPCELMIRESSSSRTTTPCNRQQ